MVTLNQFTFGSATNSPEATGLPVRLGVALLKDLDGNIVIDLPIKGSLDDPDFKIGRVVLRVIVNLLLKAATSPFSLIGAAFGGGGDELAYQDFSPGVTHPLDAELKKIETLRKALKGRPGLSLDITGSFDATTDRAAVQSQRLDQQVRYRLWEELRVKNPQTPPPDEITVPPAEEARIVGRLFADRVPAVKPQGAAATSAKPVPAVTPVAPEPAQTVDVVSAAAGPHRLGLLKKTRKAPKPVTPVVIVGAIQAVPTAGGAPAPLTLAEARQSLAAEITVSDDDLRQLAEARGQQVRDALLVGGEIDAGRIFLTPPAPEGKGAKVFLQLR